MKKFHTDCPECMKNWPFTDPRCALCAGVRFVPDVAAWTACPECSQGHKKKYHCDHCDGQKWVPRDPQQ